MSTRHSGSSRPETRAAPTTWSPRIRRRRLAGPDGSSRSGATFARAIIEVAERLGTCNNTVSLRWTSAHKGVEGNGVADGYAKETAESAWDAVDRPYLREASFAC